MSVVQQLVGIHLIPSPFQSTQIKHHLSHTCLERDGTLCQPGLTLTIPIARPRKAQEWIPCAWSKVPHVSNQRLKLGNNCRAIVFLFTDSRLGTYFLFWTSSILRSTWTPLALWPHQNPDNCRSSVIPVFSDCPFTGSALQNLKLDSAEVRMRISSVSSTSPMIPSVFVGKFAPWEKRRGNAQRSFITAAVNYVSVVTRHSQHSTCKSAHK